MMQNEEKKALIGILEKAAGRPFERFYELDAEWSRIYGFDKSFEEAAVTAEKTKKEVEPFSDETEWAISNAFKALDPSDPEEKYLLERIEILVLVAFRRMIASMVFRAVGGSTESRQAYYSEIAIKIHQALPGYDRKLGKLSTFIYPKILWGLDEADTAENGSEVSRYYQDVARYVNAALEVLGNGDNIPNATEIAEFIKEEKGKTLSVKTIENYFERCRKRVAFSEAIENTVPGAPSPEAVLLAAEKQEEVWKAIKKIDCPIPRAIMLLRLEYLEEHDTDIPLMELKRRIQEMFPNVQGDDVRKWRNYANNVMMNQLRQDRSTKTCIFSSYEMLDKTGHEEDSMKIKTMLTASTASQLDYLFG